MRRCAFVAVCLAAASVRADDTRADDTRADSLSLSASIGAGAQGAATYGALELRLDQRWHDVQLGLGVRGVWDDGVFRRRDWSGPAELVTIVRELEAAVSLDDGGHLALAAGRLAPAHVGRIADGYRSTLDDRWRTGVRTAAVTTDTEATLEIDDVLDPALIGGALDYQVAAPYRAHVAVAIDPDQPALIAADGSRTTRVATVVEAGAARRLSSETSRTDVGVSIVAELGLGFSAVGYVDTTVLRGDHRYTVRADARAGSGTTGAMFGPLYRIERATMWQRAHDRELEGGSLGGTVGVAAPAGWLELGLRTRPGLGLLATASAGLPMASHLQAALWAAASRAEAAGAAELRLAWARRLFSAVQAARIYDFTDPMQPAAVWSLTAWFGAATD